VASALAAVLGVKLSSLITSSTRCRVAGLMFVWAFSTRDTVMCDTPASDATRRMPVLPG
jgi:hypothetical protein